MTDNEIDSRQSVAELVRHATSQVSTLVRDELALARAEVTGKLRSAGTGAAYLGAAAVAAVYGLGLLMAVAVAALATIWPLWLALLAVALLVLAAAGIAAAAGRAQLRKAMPLAPTEPAAGLAADVQTVVEATRKDHPQ
jgi:hypothetical protein